MHEASTFIALNEPTAPVKPTAPTKLALPILKEIENVKGGVKISWNKVSGAAMYRVFYKTGNGKWKKLTDTTATSYTWKKAKSGIKYTFTVRCISSDGKNYTSNYNKTGKSIKYIASPVLTKVQNTNGGVKVTWKKPNGAVKYRVFRKTGNGKWVKVGDTTSTSYTWKKVVSGKTYRFTVRCIGKDGKYASYYDNVGKSITYLASPTITSLRNPWGRTVDVIWNTVSGASGYQVQYSPSRDFKTPSKTITIKKPNYIAQLFIVSRSNTTYYVRMRCFKTLRTYPKIKFDEQKSAYAKR